MYNAFIQGEDYQRLLASNDTIVTTLIQNYIYWHNNGGGGDPKTSSSTLWDPTATYMTFSNMSLMNFDHVNMVVDNNGDTVVATSGQPVNVAYSWIPNGLSKWAALCVEVLLSD